jgi:hypothetical protein
MILISLQVLCQYGIEVGPLYNRHTNCSNYDIYLEHIIVAELVERDDDAVECV